VIDLRPPTQLARNALAAALSYDTIEDTDTTERELRDPLVPTSRQS
jgi:hypothetical protein